MKTTSYSEKFNLDTWSKQTQTKPILVPPVRHSFSDDGSTVEGSTQKQLSAFHPSQFPAPGNQAVNCQCEKEYIKEHNKFYVPCVIQADTNNIYANPQAPAFNFPLCRKCRCDKTHYCRECVNIWKGRGIRKKVRQIEMNPAHRKS